MNNKIVKNIKKAYFWVIKTWPRRILASLLIIIFILTPLSFLLFNKKTSAAWFDDNWYYRKSIQLTNNTTAENNVYVSVTIDTSDTAKFQADCGDLRFTKYNGEVMPYYIASGCGTSSTSVYVNFDVFPAGQQTIYYYYGNPSAPNGFTTSSGSGSVTQSNMRLSVVNGTAFTDFSSAGTLTENLGKKVTITDSAGKKLTGYTKAAGTGETYGAEDASNSTLENLSGIGNMGPTQQTILSTETVGCHTGNCLRATIYSADTYGGWQVYTNNAPDGSLYKYSSWAKQDTTNSIDMFTAYSNGTQTQTTGWVYPSSWTQYALYQTTNNSGQWNKLTWYIHDAAGKSALFDDASTEQVLTPSATGVTITSTANGATFNWASEESGFNRNDSSNYTYIIYPSAFSTAASNYTVGSLGSEEKSTAPVGYWSFDEGYGGTAHDETSNKNDGSFLSAPVWKTEDQCVSGKCLAFDNVDDGVSITNQNFTSLTDYTMCSWVNPKGNHKNYTGTIMSSGDWNNTHWAFGINQSNTYLQTRKADGVNSPTWSYTFSLSRWSYACITRSGATITAYVDGKTIGSPYTGTTGNIISNATNTTIGRETYAGGYFAFNGSIDEPKIYPYARTVAQIRQDYNAGLAGAGKAKEGASVSIGGGSEKWLTDGLVGHWKTDEASWNGTSGEVKDASGNGNNGTRVGDATTTAGKFGNGGTFDGAGDYVSVSDSSNGSLDFGTSIGFSISSWVKGVNLASYNGIVGKCGQDNSCAGYELFTAGGGTSASLRLTWTGGPQYGQQTSGSFNFNDNKYHNLIAVVNRALNKSYIFVDGNQIASGDISSVGSLDNSQQFTFGFNGAGYWQGLQDDTRIYNRALSPGEVKDLYEWAPGPVGYWKLDEKSGTSAQDTSGNGNIGTLTNSPTWDNGKYGSAVRLATDNRYINVPALTPNIINKSLTIEGWVNTNLTGIQRLFTASGGSPQIGFNGTTLFIHTTTSAGTDNNLPYTALPSSCQFGWHHIALTWDTLLTSNNVKAYCDGINFTSATLVNALNGTFNISSLKIGYDTSTQSVNGPVDDAKIYNYVRTQKQILEDMNAGQKGTLEPVAYYKFDEGYNTKANNSVNGNGNVTLAKCLSATTYPAWDNDGKFNKSLTFSGAVYPNCHYAYLSYQPWMGTGDQAWSFWYKPGNTSQTGYIMNRYLGSAANIAWAVLQNGQNIQIKVSPDGTLGSVQTLTGTSNPLIASSWQHINITFTSGIGFKIYVNGELKDTFSYTSPIFNNTTQLYFGTDVGANSPISGSIDEVKIYNYALTADDVKADFNRGSSAVLGSTGTTSTGAPDSSTSREYCVPGDATSCAGPVGEWKMDEKVSGDAKTLNDTSGNGNNGTSNDGANNTGMDCSKTGKYGSACQFDGADDYIDISNAINSDYLTFSSWFKVKADGTINTIFGSDNASNTPTISHWSNNNLIVYLSGNCYRYLPNSNITDFNWHYLAVVIDQTDKTDCNSMFLNSYYFLDGKYGSLSSGNNGTPVNYFVGNLRIGNTIPSSYSFNGSIDQVRIYDYARTPAQIAWDYNKGKPVAEWRFDECQGGTVHDESGNGNNGTLTVGGTGSQDGIGTCTDGDTTNAWYNGRTGKKNASLNFDGTDDYVNLGSLPSSNVLQLGTGAITVSHWVKLTGTAGYRSIFFGGATGGATGYGTTFQDGTTNIRYGIYGSTGGQQMYVVNGGITLNNWYHIVAIFDGIDNKMKLYVNGAEKHNVSISDPGIATYAGNFSIGSHGGYGWYFPGQIDEVKIFNYALTEDQVKNVYNNSSAVYFGN